MDVTERFDLITRNLQEVLGEKELLEKLASTDNFTVYWGTAPTGSISLAYFFPMLKVADLLNAGCTVKILLADLHAALDGTSWGELESKTAYYEEALKTILKTLGVPSEKLDFVRGSTLQQDAKYFSDLLRLSTVVSVKDSKKAASEVVKLGENPRMSGFIYPLMQALDEVHLNADAQLGGVDQRKIVVFARENLPKIGYHARIELMNPIIRGLVGEKMSASAHNTKIDLMDSIETVKKKVKKADCIVGDPRNGIMSLLKNFIMIVKKDRAQDFLIERDEKFGGNIVYQDYETLEKDFISKKLHPLDLKNAVTLEINNFLKNFRNNKTLKKLYDKAYTKA